MKKKTFNIDLNKKAHQPILELFEVIEKQDGGWLMVTDYNMTKYNKVLKFLSMPYKVESYKVLTL